MVAMRTRYIVLLGSLGSAVGVLIPSQAWPASASAALLVSATVVNTCMVKTSPLVFGPLRPGRRERVLAAGRGRRRDLEVQRGDSRHDRDSSGPQPRRRFAHDPRDGGRLGSPCLRSLQGSRSYQSLVGRRRRRTQRCACKLDGASAVSDLRPNPAGARRCAKSVLGSRRRID